MLFKYRFSSHWLLCRRAVLHAWWDVAAEALKAGKKRARLLEQKLWQEHNLTVEVSPAGKVKDLSTGHVVGDWEALSSQLIAAGCAHTRARATEP